MSEHRPEFGSEQPNVESEATGTSTANGADPEDAVGVPDGSAEEPVATHGEPADESPMAAELTGETSVSGAPHDATATPAEPAYADERSVFLAELVRAMQTTAGLERVRIGEDTGRRRQAHIDRVRARQASEADRMRELAGEDLKTIKAWADAETKRIQLERERRAKALQEDLNLSLAEHGSKIDREIEGVETAIATYRADVDAFFEGLDRETDLILIAQQASRRPVFPTLESVAETVAAGAAEPAVVGVMGPQAAAEPVESWAAPPETSPEPASAGASEFVDQSGEAPEPAEPVAAATGSSHGSAGSLLESVPVPRPTSWFRRDANGEDRSKREG